MAFNPQLISRVNPDTGYLAPAYYSYGIDGTSTDTITNASAAGYFTDALLSRKCPGRNFNLGDVIAINKYNAAGVVSGYAIRVVHSKDAQGAVTTQGVTTS